MSSGVEPPYALFYDRTIQGFDGQSVERVEDYAYSLGIKGRTANEISADDHVKVLALASKFVDSAVSKTCNVGDEVTYDEFKELYYKAWVYGCKGITTFRGQTRNCQRSNDNEEQARHSIDPETGQRSANELPS